MPLFFLVIALGSGVLIGVSALVARAIGSKERLVSLAPRLFPLFSNVAE